MVSEDGTRHYANQYCIKKEQGRVEKIVFLKAPHRPDTYCRDHDLSSEVEMSAQVTSIGLKRYVEYSGRRERCFGATGS